MSYRKYPPDGPTGWATVLWLVVFWLAAIIVILRLT